MREILAYFALAIVIVVVLMCIVANASPPV